MRIGFDVDGVLASFTPAYQALVIKHAGGVNLFHPNDDKHPPCWDWPEHRGYKKGVMQAVWKDIKTSHAFWLSLSETPDCSTLRMVVLDLLRHHDVYFITSRPGSTAKWQTEQWLILHLGIERPTVLISIEKGLCAKALNLDCYIDDNLDNVNDVSQQTHPQTGALSMPSTRTYLLNKSYNQQTEGLFVRRVYTVGQFLDAELANL